MKKENNERFNYMKKKTSKKLKFYEYENKSYSLASSRKRRNAKKVAWKIFVYILYNKKKTQ